jgi:sterol desaturase/sphingolipid hydroxylase (fatty acid hydroxylase superfamily)
MPYKRDVIAPHASPTVPRGSWRRALVAPPRWPAAVLAVAVAIGLATGTRAVWGLAVAAVIGVGLERLWPRHVQPVLRDGLRTDIVHWLVTGVLRGASLFVAVVLCWIPLQHLTIETTAQWLQSLPTAVTVIIGFVLFTFVQYWYHRMTHEVGVLWRFHAIHHSSAHLDWIAASRLHPLEGFFFGLLIAPPMIVLGFRPTSIAALQAFTTAWAVLEHSNVSWRLSWLDRIYPNVDYHHWHHCADADARDTNFGLPLWDTLFGTYSMPEDRRPTRYGIDTAVPTTYLGQLAMPLRRRRAPVPF